MTREAKIGMLTGLGVIVAIGVLLSEYLGDGHAAAASDAAPMRQTSALPIGHEYRQQVLHEVGVPTMAGGSAPDSSMQQMGIPPVAFAADRENETMVASGPRVSDPANVISMSQLPPENVIIDPPTFEVKTKEGAPLPPPPAPNTGITYEIAQGDKLATIAKKFYNSTKNSDVQRIVAANATILKDANTVLQPGKKLVIPGVEAHPPITELRKPANSGTPFELPKSPDNLITKKPDAPQKPQAKDAPKPTPANVYVVQPGDTLSKIARKLSPTKSDELMKKLIAANGIKKPDSLTAGTKLKVPG